MGGDSDTDDGHHRQPAPLSLNEALQFTALTSVIPTTGITSLTSIPQITERTSIFTLGEIEEQQSRELYDTLNARTVSDEHARFIAERVERYREVLMTQNDNTPLSFQLSREQASLPSTNAQLNDIVRSFHLGSFAEQIFQRTEVPFTLSSESHSSSYNPLIPVNALWSTLRDAPTFGSSSVRRQQQQQEVPWNNSAVQLSIESEINISREQGNTAHMQSPAMENNVLEMKPPGKRIKQDSMQTTNPVTSQEGQLNAALMGSDDINMMAKASHPQTPNMLMSDTSYSSKPYPSSETSSSGLSPMKINIGSNNSPLLRKRKQTDDVDSPGATTSYVIDTPRSKSKLAWEALESIVDSIFEADDNLESDTSGTQGTISSIWMVGRSDTEPLLSNEVQIRVEGALRRVFSANLYDNLPLDSILRLQKICGRTIRKALDLSWRGREGLTEGDESEIINNLSLLDSGLKACKTVLRTMLGSREEKQICSEDLMKDIVDLINSLLESLVLPLVSPMSDMNDVLTFRKLMIGILQETTRILNTTYLVLQGHDLDESVITKLEFMATNVIFVETIKEKESYFGNLNIENLRVASMDILAQIFASYTDQRTFILGEILTSIEKLPIGRISARQFKLTGGSSIQLVTALILRLTQTAGTFDKKLVPKSSSFGMNIDIMSLDDREAEAHERDDFIKECQKCHNQAIKCANDVANFLVERTVKSIKTGGESPYRVLLDMFTEDFIAVLELPEWPSAELLLRCLSMHMIGCADPDTHGAQVNSMALDVLGTVGSKLITVRQAPNQLAGITSSVTKKELDHTIETLNHVLLHLHKRISSEPTVSTAHGYTLTEWISIFSGFLDIEYLSNDLIKAIRKLIFSAIDESWTLKENFNDDSDSTIKSQYVQILLTLPLSKLYDRILSEILRSLDNSKILTRSKALRVLNQLLAKDPSILTDPSVMASVSGRLVDSSAQVRDAAVDIVGKYILIKPEVTEKFYPMLCERSGDTGTGVRRRVLKLLKDIYLSTIDPIIKIEIAERLLRRTEDEDSGVENLAKKTIEDIWFHLPIDEDGDLPRGSEIDMRVNILLQTRDRSEKAARLIQTTIENIFDKNDHNNLTIKQYASICKRMVERLFEMIIECSDMSKISLQSLFGLLSTFAMSYPSIFEPDQLVSLLIYLQDDKISGDMTSYYVLVIFRNLLPLVGAMRTKFIAEVQQVLLKRLSKFNLRELSEAMPCLWEASSLLKDTRRLAVTAISCLKVLAPFKSQVAKGELKVADPKLVRLLHLLGNFGRYCNLEQYFSMFQQVPGVKGRSVTEIIVNTMQVFAHPSVITPIRKIAVRNLGIISIAHPQIFVSPMALNVLDDVLNKGDKDLRDTVVKVLSEFLTYEQKKADDAVRERGGTDLEVDIGVLQGSTTKFANDGVCASLVQRYLDNILSIALGSEDEYAFAAILLLEKIVRQGYPNPRSCIPTIIALETSKQSAIRGIALEMHQKLHEKHESLIEGSYVDGVKKAVQYGEAMRSQRGENYSEDTCIDPLFSVIKGSRATRKKFFLGITRAMDFDPAKLTVGDAGIHHLKFVRFVGVNISTLELSTTEDAHLIVYGLDKIISGTGMSVLYMISDIQGQSSLDQRSDAEKQGNAKTTMQSIQEVAVLCVILYTIWQIRQHIKRLYNLSEQNCRTFSASSRGNSKDLKQAVRASGYDEHLYLEDFCLREDIHQFNDDESSLAIIEQTREILTAVDDTSI
ncbi:sister chromatid cohesion C-terminus-domain-containing protein [Dipodascopsis uninucleata]